MEDKTCHMEGDLWELMDLGLMIKDFLVFTEGKRISFRGQSHSQALPFLNTTSFHQFLYFEKIPCPTFQFHEKVFNKKYVNRKQEAFPWKIYLE